MSSLSALTSGELERLSAYLDGELETQEAERLRARLERDPGLRRALAELQQTAGLLRTLPVLKPPRSFSLSPERAAATRRYPRLQLATALAGLAFFLVVGADVLTSAVWMAAPSEGALGISTPPAAAALQAGTPTPLGTEAPAAIPPPTASAAGESAPAGEPEQTAQPADADTPAPTEVAGLRLTEGEETLAEQELPAAEVEAELASEAAGSETALAPVDEVAGPRDEPRPDASMLLRLLEAGLGGATVVLAVLTVRARRRR
jgi:anti-sigma factor RsiW